MILVVRWRRVQTTDGATVPPALRKGAVMDQICVVFPILPGKTEDARAFQRELDTERKSEYTRSEQAIGITREYWYSLPRFYRATISSASWRARDFPEITGAVCQVPRRVRPLVQTPPQRGHWRRPQQPATGHETSRTGIELRGITSCQRQHRLGEGAGLSYGGAEARKGESDGKRC